MRTAVAVLFAHACLSCPAGWQSHNGWCFRANCRHLPYYDAEEFCVSQGGHLATASTPATNSFLRQLLPYSPIAWIGLHEPNRMEGSWNWQYDGSVVVWNNWKDFKGWRSEPSNSRDENCACLGWCDVGDAAWVDIPCNLSMPFVCQSNRYNASAVQTEADIDDCLHSPHNDVVRSGCDIVLSLGAAIAIAVSIGAIMLVIVALILALIFMYCCCNDPEKRSFPPVWYGCCKGGFCCYTSRMTISHTSKRKTSIYGVTGLPETPRMNGGSVGTSQLEKRRDSRRVSVAQAQEMQIAGQLPPGPPGSMRGLPTGSPIGSPNRRNSQSGSPNAGSPGGRRRSSILEEVDRKPLGPDEAALSPSQYRRRRRSSGSNPAQSINALRDSAKRRESDAMRDAERFHWSTVDQQFGTVEDQAAIAGKKGSKPPSPLAMAECEREAPTEHSPRRYSVGGDKRPSGGPRRNSTKISWRIAEKGAAADEQLPRRAGAPGGKHVLGAFAAPHQAVPDAVIPPAEQRRSSGVRILHS